MKLRTKPKPPVRIEERGGIYEVAGKTVGEILNKLNIAGADINKTYISLYHEEDDWPRVEINYTVYETDEDFLARQNKYEEDLSSYNQWLKDNKEEIEIEKKRLAAKAKANREARLARDRTRLEKELAKLEKRREQIRERRKKLEKL